MKTTHDLLVIDDEGVVLQGVQRICASEGLTVITASSAMQGLTQLEQSTFRLILCDLMMEGMDGFEFLSEAHKRMPGLPIVMTTGYSTVENAVRSLHCGAIDYLAKPFTTDELLAVVFRALNFSAPQTSDIGIAPLAEQEARLFHCLGLASWAKREASGTVLVGITATFLKTLNGLTGIELLPMGTELAQGACCATLISANGLRHGLLCPVSGRLITCHEEVAQLASTIEKDPYGTGWLYRILPTNLEQGLTCLTPLSETAESQPANRKGETS